MFGICETTFGVLSSLGLPSARETMILLDLVSQSTIIIFRGLEHMTYFKRIRKAEKSCVCYVWSKAGLGDTLLLCIRPNKSTQMEPVSSQRCMVEG